MPLSTRSMDNQHRLCRNLPAELKVEIVDCLPRENAAHFLASVPNRLIIHHCAPRLRRILKMIEQIVNDYAHALLAPDSNGDIMLINGHQYTPEMHFFLRYGAAHCYSFYIWRGTSGGFVGYPANFFNDLIKHYYETKVPARAIRYLDIELPEENPAPWPAALVQPQAGELNVEELEVNNDEKWALYILRNKHNPGIAFGISIDFDGDAECYQQMANFSMWRVEVVQSVQA